MGIYDRLLGRFGLARKNVSSLELFREIYGGKSSASGVTVNWKTALEVSTVLACCRVIANGIAQVPFRLYQDTGDGTKSVAVKHPLNRILYRRPNAWQTSFGFRETIAFHAVLAGNAYIFVNRVGIAREIKELIPIEPSRVEAKQLPDYRIEYKVRADSGEVQIFGEEAIWHLRGPSWNSWLGFELTKIAREAVGLAVALEKGQAEFQKNGGRSSGLLAVDEKLSPEKYAFLAAWLDKYAVGGERANKPMIADQGAKFTPFTMTGVDQQLIESRKFQVEEICREFGVLPIMVGASDKAATYASVEQMLIAHVVHTLSPWYERIEHSADNNLLSEKEIAAGYYTKFSPNGLMRGSFVDRTNGYAKALGSGGSAAYMTPNEVRALEEMDKIDGGDELAKPAQQATPAPAPPAGGN